MQEKYTKEEKEKILEKSTYSEHKCESISKHINSKFKVVDFKMNKAGQLLYYKLKIKEPDDNAGFKIRECEYTVDYDSRTGGGESDIPQIVKSIIKFLEELYNNPNIR